MQTLVAIFLLAIALILFWAWRTHKMEGDTLNAIAAILTVIAGVAAILLFIVPAASLPPFSAKTNTPEIEVTKRLPTNTAFFTISPPNTPLSATPLSTYTPYPSQTPLPTYTTVPTPSPTIKPLVELPFKDNFDNGLRPEWQLPVAGGVWRILNGKLTVTGLTEEKWSYIFVGDPSWENYSVDVDYKFGKYSTYVGILVRSQGTYNFGLSYIANYYDTFWKIWQDSNWMELASKRKDNYDGYGHLRVEVKGNNFTGYVNGVPQMTISDSSTKSGYVGLGIDCNNVSGCSEFDNLVIEQISP
jgi:hypothetical protein